MSLDRALAPDPYSLLPRTASFVVSSPDIADGTAMDSTFADGSAGGGNQSPALSWSGFPEATRGFVVTCFDPDAPTESGFWHWVVVGLPVEVTSLPRGASANLPAGAFHVRNDLGTAGYNGAAPPEGDRAHRYYFAVHAVDTDDLGLSRDASPAVVSFTVGFHLLARAVLVATFQA
jgi:Raf kinase inhibitor-like YbhB/YbcL family protein